MTCMQHFEEAKITKIPKLTGDYELLTLAQSSKEFECHINVEKLATIEMTSSKAKQGDWQLHVIRFKNVDDRALVTALLPGRQGVYDDTDLKKWEAVKERFGELQQLL